MSAPTHRQVTFLEVSANESGQRLDNYLLRNAQNVPKTRVYRAIRKGEVRVNKARSKPHYRVQEGDLVRIPPLSITERSDVSRPFRGWERRIREAVMFDDTDLLVINKPTGLAVHGGTGVKHGLIESLRTLFPEQRYLELAHRLDRDTSGIVLIAKNARTLRELHEQLRADRVDKVYWTLVVGKWPAYQKSVSAPLSKRHTLSGERIVKVSADGKKAKTEFKVLERFPSASLLEVKPISGRTHQIRVHSQHVGHPILGDTKYHNDSSDEITLSLGLKRMFLHAKRIRFRIAGRQYELECPLSAELEAVLSRLRGERN